MSVLRSSLVIAVVALALLAALFAVGLIERLELITLDARYASGVGRKAPREDVVIAWIDQESMDFMDQNDVSFPWPRSVYEAVLGYLYEGGAQSVAFDLLFDQRLLAEDDDVFAAAVAADPRAALAMKFVGFRPGGRAPEETERQRARALALGAPRDPATEVAGGFVLPLSELDEAARWTGFVNVRPDADKVYRRYELVRSLAHEGEAATGTYLSLAAAAYLAGGGELETLHSRAPARALLNFRGPEFTFEHVKFVNLLVSLNNVAEGLEPLYPAERFAGKHVLVGIHAEGYEDIHPTPLSRKFPGVELHATALDNLLAGDFLRERGSAPLLGALAALLGVAAVFLLPGVARPSAVLVVLGLAWGGGNWFAFGEGLVLPLAAPLLGLTFGGVGSFVWRVAVEGRQKREMRRAFSSYMAPEVLAQVLEHPEQLALGGEAREVTLFFSDLAGFTGLAEHIGPEALVQFLNDYFTRMCEPVLAERGVIDKFIGDAIMALFGAPLRGSNHALDAVRAGLAASAVSARIAAELLAAGRPAIETRIGCHTGPAIVGNMGSAKRFDYTAIGDTVNLASRLEGANKAFGTRFMVSEITWAAAIAEAPELVGREIGLVGVKGREEPIRVYEPLAMGPLPPERAARLERHGAALAALRKGELELARAEFEALRAGDAEDALVAHYCEALDRPGWDGVWRLDSK